MAIRFELGDKTIEPGTVLRPYLTIDGDGDTCFRCKTPRGRDVIIGWLTTEGKLRRSRDVSPMFGFTLDEHGRIELDE